MLDVDIVYMISCGLCILGVCLCQYYESSLCIVEWLVQYLQVVWVNYFVLFGSKGYEFWKCDFIGSSGLFLFVFSKCFNDVELVEYFDNFSLFSMVYLWGGFELLIFVNQLE